MSGLEVLSVVAGVAACISAFADARQLYKDWKTKRDNKKNGGRVARRSKVPSNENFDTAITLYSEYIQEYFSMVSELEGESWRQGDETCLEVMTTQLQYFREEVLVVLETKTNDGVVIDWVKLTSVTMKVGFEYMIAMDGQFERISYRYFVHQSILDIRSVGVSIEKLGDLPAHPKVKYQWVNDASESRSRDDQPPSSRNSALFSKFRARSGSSSGPGNVDVGGLGLCSFAIELLKDPCMMTDGWSYDSGDKKIKYVQGNLPRECPRCEQPFGVGTAKHSNYHVPPRKSGGGNGDLTPRFFAKHHLPKTENQYNVSPDGTVAHLREEAKSNRHVCIHCFVKQRRRREYNRREFLNHVRECENWEWYRRNWHSLTKVPDVDYYPCPRGSDGRKSKYDEPDERGEYTPAARGYIDPNMLRRRGVIGR